MEHYELHISDAGCAASLAVIVRRLVAKLRTDSQEIVLFCIGTDRCVGDALGPLVGSQLSEAGLVGVHIYGTLFKPVHANNLEDCLEEAERRHPGAFVIAVDACLGRLASIGSVAVAEGAARPGEGVHKSLPPVGDMHIMGVVNVGGFMDYFMLQNSRLYTVVRLAKAISEGLLHGLQSIVVEQEVAATSER